MNAQPRLEDNWLENFESIVRKPHTFARPAMHRTDIQPDGRTDGRTDG